MLETVARPAVTVSPKSIQSDTSPARGGKEMEMILPQRGNLNWSTFGVMALFHVGAIVALFMFSWKVFFASFFLYWVAIGLGISMGYHRLHTHRSYTTHRWVEYALAVCGTLNLEGGPIFWVATHRIHHQKSDQPGDPHSPNDGAFWSHVGWILFGEVNHNNTRLMSKYAPDLAKHKFYVWLNNYHWVPIIVLAAILYAIGGAPLFFWGIFLRVTVGLHATWLVNSAAHMFGSRRFETRDDSRNSWWVAMVSFGEGWHNNHHAHPTSARHGLAWYEVDFSWITLRIMQAVGLVSNLKVARLATSFEDREAA
jgi:stearoyl-CoA desaturase (Delta-9 desaturase)